MRSGDGNGKVWTPGWALRLFVLPLTSAYLLASSLNWVLDTRFPYQLGDIAGKYKVFSLRRDDFTTIFLGSSGTTWGILPQVFDETLARHGCTQLSFNFGMAGESAPLIYEVLKVLLESPPRNLKWVFLDATVSSEIDFLNQPFSLITPDLPSPPKRHFDYTLNPDFVYWHTLESTLDASRFILSSNLSIWPKLQLVGAHWGAYLRNVTDTGPGAAKVRFDVGQLRFVQPPYRSFSAEGGLTPVQGSRYGQLRKQRDHRPEFTEAIYDRTITAMAHLPPLDIPPYRLRHKESVLRKIVDLLGSRGIRTILFAPPRVDPFEPVENDVGAPLFLFQSPRETPELYDYAVRFDRNHLNKKGAALFSAMLADRVAKTMGCTARPPT